MRKRAEKEADNRAKEEEERREMARQARKLEFLISQTELYSHFVGNKLKSEVSSHRRCFDLTFSAFRLAAEIEGESNVDGTDVPKGAEGQFDLKNLSAIDFDDGQLKNLI